jgi:hypothetical protein
LLWKLKLDFSSHGACAFTEKNESASNLWSIACEVPPYEWIRTKVGNQQANKRITMVLGNN